VEYVNSIWQIGIIALVAGALIGALVYRLFAPSVKQADQVKTELDAAREELGSYKDSVNQHFDKTSELVNDLTQNYVKVYQHLAAGAQTLGDSKTLTNLLEQHPGKVSIAVANETNVPDTVADDLVVEPVVTPAKSAETVDEHAEPFIDQHAGGTEPVEPVEPVEPEHDTAEPGASNSSIDPDDSAESTEPVLNVEALEEANEEVDDETRAQAGSAVPEGEEKIEVRTTTH